MKRRLDIAICVAAILLHRPLIAAAEDPAETVVTYDQVRPVFRKHCLSCHNAERPRGDLDLSSADSIMAGAGSGPVVVAAKSNESLIYTMAAHLEEPFMPPNSPKIPQRELDLIRRWIDGGLKGRNPSAEKPVAPVVTKPAGASSGSAPTTAVAPLRRKATITALAVSPTAPVAVLSGRKQAVLFSLTDRKPLRAIPFPEGDLFVAKFSRDGEWLLLAGGEGAASGKVVGVEVSTGRRLFELGDETDVVLAADLSADKRLIALGGPGRTVKILRTADGSEVAALRKHTDWILSLAFSPDGLLLASSDRFGGLMIWEAETGKEFFNFRGHVGPIPAVAWSDDGDRLVSAGQDGTLCWWDLHRGESIAQWPAHSAGAISLAVAARKQILSGGRDRQFAVWDTDNRKLWDLALSDEVIRIAATPDGETAVVADADGHVDVVSLTERKVVGALELPVDASLARAPSAAGRSVAQNKESRPGAPPKDLQSDRAGDSAQEATRQALAAAEAAVKSAETALSDARAAAGKLRKLLDRQEAESRTKRPGQQSSR